MAPTQKNIFKNILLPKSSSKSPNQLLQILEPNHRKPFPPIPPMTNDRNILPGVSFRLFHSLVNFEPLDPLAFNMNDVERGNNVGRIRRARNC